MDEQGLSEHGLVKITGSAIAAIAAAAARQVEGVTGMAEGLASRLGRWLLRRDGAPGVSVTLADKEVSMTVDILVAYGADIAEVASEVQRDVARVVEEMTNLSVREVNVNVRGIRPAEKSAAGGPDFQA